jgi:hypothetical protein
VFPDQLSTETPETSEENTQWLVLDELVSHDLPESSPPGSPRPYLKSESNEPVAEAGQVPTAAELAERAAFREEAEEYELAACTRPYRRRSPSQTVRLQWNIQHGCTLTAIGCGRVGRGCGVR